MPAEKIHFKDYNEFFNFVKRNSPRKAEFIVNHERQHYEMASKLGYKPIYSTFLVPDSSPIVIAYFIDFKEKVKPRDMIKICLAPDNPGEDDKRLALKLDIILKLENLL